MKAVFRMSPKVSSELILGTLTLEDDEGETVFSSVTSGIPGHQDFSNQWERGKGLLPDSVQIYEPYSIGVERLFANNVKACGDYLFAVKPFTIWRKDEKEKRSNICLHLDANHATSPGSAGCIVFTDEQEWDEFQSLMEDLWVCNEETIDLEVIYA